MNSKFEKFLPKSQGVRDILLLVVLIVPLAIAGVIWGIFGDFSETREPMEPTPVDLQGTPAGSPEATPEALYFIENA